MGYKLNIHVPPIADDGLRREQKQFATQRSLRSEQTRRVSKSISLLMACSVVINESKYNIVVVGGWAVG